VGMRSGSPFYHFESKEALLGAVMLEGMQRGEVNRLKDRYEGDWVPELQALHAQGQLGAEPVLARLMIFGALNWSAQWYVPPSGRSAKARSRASLDELTESALKLFLKEPA
jgi:AcrR family transcriptional regulator